MQEVGVLWTNKKGYFLHFYGPFKKNGIYFWLMGFFCFFQSNVQIKRGLLHDITPSREIFFSIISANTVCFKSRLIFILYNFIFSYWFYESKKLFLQLICWNSRKIRSKINISINQGGKKIKICETAKLNRFTANDCNKSKTSWFT